LVRAGLGREGTGGRDDMVVVLYVVNCWRMRGMRGLAWLVDVLIEASDLYR
jgi:hypothetical protein